MAKWISAAVGTLVLASLVQLGCEEEMVGAPCVPETDKGEFSASLTGETWSIETRSVQCETRLCATVTKENAQVNGDVCALNPSVENCWEAATGAVQAKYSFCSCRCADVAGHTLNSNPDKYDYLCECPPDTKCLSVLKDIEDAPDMIKGSYCVPRCMANDACFPDDIDGDGELENRMCTPSSDSEKPWQWTCKEVE